MFEESIHLFEICKMSENISKKRYTPKAAYPKAMRFCAYQERSYKQVREKLYDLGLCSEDVENMLVRLSSDNFLNEERYAKAYVSGKFRQNKWGRNKIKQGLKQEAISAYCTKKGLAEIDDGDYDTLLLNLLNQKWLSLTDKNHLQKKQKVYNYMLSKGFEGDLVLDILKTMH